MYNISNAYSTVADRLLNQAGGGGLKYTCIPSLSTLADIYKFALEKAKSAFYYTLLISFLCLLSM